jgi:hypothetical protein
MLIDYNYNLFEVIYNEFKVCLTFVDFQVVKVSIFLVPYNKLFHISWN